MTKMDFPRFDNPTKFRYSWSQFDKADCLKKFWFANRCRVLEVRDCSGLEIGMASITSINGASMPARIVCKLSEGIGPSGPQHRFLVEIWSRDELPGGDRYVSISMDGSTTLHPIASLHKYGGSSDMSLVGTVYHNLMADWLCHLYSWVANGRKGKPENTRFSSLIDQHVQSIPPGMDEERRDFGFLAWKGRDLIRDLPYWVENSVAIEAPVAINHRFEQCGMGDQDCCYAAILDYYFLYRDLMTVVDHKTSRKIPGDNFLNETDQLRNGIVCLSREEGLIDVEEIGFRQKYCFPRHYSKSTDPDYSGNLAAVRMGGVDKEEICRAAHKMAKTIHDLEVNNEWKANPGGACDFCDFKGECGEYQEWSRLSGLDQVSDLDPETCRRVAMVDKRVKAVRGEIRKRVAASGPIPIDNKNAFALVEEQDYSYEVGDQFLQACDEAGIDRSLAINHNVSRKQWVEKVMKRPGNQLTEREIVLRFATLQKAKTSSNLKVVEIKK